MRVDPSTLFLLAAAIVLAGIAYLKDPGLPLIVAGLIQVLVPQDVVSRHFGRQAGLRALVIALPVLAGWLVATFYQE